MYCKVFLNSSSEGSVGNFATADYSTHNDFGLFSSNMFLVGVMLSPASSSILFSEVYLSSLLAFCREILSDFVPIRS